MRLRNFHSLTKHQRNVKIPNKETVDGFTSFREIVDRLRRELFQDLLFEKSPRWRLQQAQMSHPKLHDLHHKAERSQEKKNAR